MLKNLSNSTSRLGLGKSSVSNIEPTQTNYRMSGMRPPAAHKAAGLLPRPAKDVLLLLPLGLLGLRPLFERRAFGLDSRGTAFLRSRCGNEAQGLAVRRKTGTRAEKNERRVAAGLRSLTPVSNRVRGEGSVSNLLRGGAGVGIFNVVEDS